MMSAHYPTDKGVAARVEELLREQLLELAKPLMKTEYGQYLQVIAKEGVL